MLDIYYYEVEIYGTEGIGGGEAFEQAKSKPLLVSREPPKGFVIYKWSLQNVVWFLCHS